jgi:hypothetical protein
MSKTIKLTEQDLRFLVENTVQAYIVNEDVNEGVWGGMKNVFNGNIRNFMQNYRNGSQASDVSKYCNKILPYLGKIYNVISGWGNEELANDLKQCYTDLSNIASGALSQAYNVAKGYSNDMNDSFNSMYSGWDERRNAEKERYTNLNAEKEKLSSDMAALQNSNNSSAEEIQKLKQQIEAEKQKYAADLKAYKEKYKKKSANLRKANAKIKGYKAQQQPQQRQAQNQY